MQKATFISAFFFLAASSVSSMAAICTYPGNRSPNSIPGFVRAQSCEWESGGRIEPYFRGRITSRPEFPMKYGSYDNWANCRVEGFGWHAKNATSCGRRGNAIVGCKSITVEVKGRSCPE